VVALAWLAGVAAAVWWGWQHWHSQAHVRNQPLSLSVPDQLMALAEVPTTVHTRLKATPVVDVPLDQIVVVKMPAQVSGSTRLDVSIPIDTVVQVAAEVPVSTQVRAEVPVVSWLPSLTVSLPIAVTVPVKLSVPFKRDVRVALDLSAQADMPQAMRLPVKTHFPLAVPLDQPLQTQVIGQTQFALRSGGEAIDVTLAEAWLNMPLKNLSLAPWPRPG
jgi:hypothetical protein